MIYIKNQLTALFSIGDIEDFIHPQNIKSFVLYENAGNLRPIIELTFILDNKNLINYLNPGNILKVSFGINELDKDIVEFKLYGDESNIEYSLGYNVTIKAALYCPKFTSLVKSCYYENQTSLEVIQQIASNNKFNLITNITKTVDRQNWEQIGETDWQYIYDVWLHSFINDQTFISFGFDCYNFYLYDVRSLVKAGNKWEFNPKVIANDSSYYVNFGQYYTKNNYGIYASLIGENLINNVFNLDNKSFSNQAYNLKNFTTIDSDKVNINSFDCKDYDYYIIDDDVHPNYVKAYNQNIRNNIMYNSFSIFIPTAAQFKKFKLFDTATIKPIVEDTRLNGVSFITAIAYQYHDNKLNVNLTLNKEAPSGIRGTLLNVGG